ncbi:hypothetical protein B0H16DRAFT_1455028 [Mycena metata]|uniref:Uncharacterized protein n=1 Tax=Mycena metata TaxID=1033252 RepID=A0AAD7JFR6_9AGAR|nr:hypothetical protein B0H16DRAFT_1455028 [Mycena metata]
MPSSYKFSRSSISSREAAAREGGVDTGWRKVEEGGKDLGRGFLGIQVGVIAGRGTSGARGSQVKGTGGVGRNGKGQGSWAVAAVNGRGRLRRQYRRKADSVDVGDAGMETGARSETASGGNKRNTQPEGTRDGDGREGRDVGGSRERSVEGTGEGEEDCEWRGTWWWERVSGNVVLGGPGTDRCGRRDRGRRCRGRREFAWKGGGSERGSKELHAEA